MFYAASLRHPSSSITTPAINRSRLSSHHARRLSASITVRWGALFFLISGFVIFMTLERTRHSVDFVRSRFLGSFPLIGRPLLTFVIYIWRICPVERLPLAGRSRIFR